jgi:large subunit ribosomal protein L23
MNDLELMNVLLEPRVSEKSVRIGDAHRQFVFRVARGASKTDVKAAVELLFKVEVSAVRVCNVKGKARRTRNGVSHRPDWRKAYVSLKPGFDINFVGAE